MDMFNVLSNFSYHVLWNFGVLFLVLLAIVLYLFLLPGSKEHTKGHTYFFLLGAIVFFIALGSPLNMLGRLIFRAHMIQMVLILFISIPLLLIGFKTKVLDCLYQVPFWQKLFHSFSKPLVGMLTFHLLWNIYHLPIVFNFVRSHYIWNYVSIFALCFAAFLLWWPIFPPIQKLKEENRKPLGFYVIGNVCLFLPMAAIYLFSSTSFYSIYSDPDLLISAVALCLPIGVSMDSLPANLLETLLPYSPVHEQKYGAIVLLISVAVIYLTLIFQYNKNKRQILSM